MQTDLTELTVRDYINILLRRWWIVAAALAVCVSAALLWSLLQTPLYRSSASILINQTSTADVFDVQTGPVAQAQRAAENEAAFMNSGVVRQAAEDLLGFPASVSVSTRNTADILEVSASSTNPRKSQAVAQTFAEVYLEQKAAQSTADYQTTAAGIQAQIEDLAAEITKLEAERAPAEDIARLQARSVSYSNTRDQLLSSVELGGADAQIIDAANLPVSPYAPRTTRNLALGFVLGVLAGVAGALLLESLDQSLNSSEEIEQLTGGLPNMALIPAMQGQAAKQGLITLEDPDSRTAEAYRTLRAAIQFMAVDRKVSVIQITSANPGEGKSTTAANLAVVLAKAGRRVVIVDGDLRKPRLHSLFNVDQQPGLTSVIIGETKVANAGRVIVKENGMLAVLPSGPVPPGPSELLGSQRTQVIFQALRDLADFVVVDSPPVIPVADALVLSNYVDATVLVVNSDKTNRRDVKHALELLEQVHAPIFGTVLNQVRHKRGYGYGYGYGYGHDSGYGYAVEGPASAAEVSKAGRLARLFRRKPESAEPLGDISWLDTARVPVLTPAEQRSRRNGSGTTESSAAWDEDEISVPKARS